MLAAFPLPTTVFVPGANRLLDLLPRRTRSHLVGHCAAVDLAPADVLAEPGGEIRHAYFPTSAVISLTIPIEGRAGVEVGLIGDEGMLGAPLVLGIGVLPFRARVLDAGQALRVDAQAFRRCLSPGSALTRLLQRYLYVVLGQMARAATCTGFHRLEERLARRLLMAHDRARLCEFHATHELLASLLGVRRVGVTQAAAALQARGLIRYRRGQLRVTDRGGLEAAACPCYAAERALYTGMLA